MRTWGLSLLTVAAVLLAWMGWHHLWPLLRHAASVALWGWMSGMAGIACLVGRRKVGGRWRFPLGLVLTALGLALLAVPEDGQGLLTGLRVGYVGAWLAVAPHSIRLYRSGPVREHELDRRMTQEEVSS